MESARSSPDWIQRLGMGLCLVLIACATALAASVRYLPMNDAPSHIANAVVAHSFLRPDDHDFLQAHYSFSFTPLPYWMTALGMIPMMGVGISALVAFQVMIASYVALLPLSVWLLQKTVSPKSDPWPMTAVAALTSFHWAYWMGESNYLLGQPLTLIGYVLFVRLGQKRHRLPLWLGFCAVSAMIYLCHIYTLTALLIAITAYAGIALLCRYIPLAKKLLSQIGIPEPLGRAQWTALGILYGLFGLALYFVFFHHGTDSNHGTPGFDLSPKRIVHMALDPYDSPGSPSRVVILGALLMVAIAVIAPLIRQRRPQGTPVVVPGLFYPALALLGAAILGPVEIRNPDGSIRESEIAIRFVLPGFLFALGALQLQPRMRPVVLAAALLLAAVKLPDAYALHRHVDSTVKEVSARLFSKIPPHKRVLPLMNMSSEAWKNYLVHRIGNYVVVERYGYSPHIFATVGQQTLRHKKWGDQRSVANLKIHGEEWNYYDYLLIQSDRKAPLVEGLTERARWLDGAGGFQLYEIRHDPRTAGAD